MTSRYSLWYLSAAFVSAIIIILFGYLQVQRQINQKITIGFIGDSITRGQVGESGVVEAELSQLGTQYVEVNCGVGGTTTEDWRPEKQLFSQALAEFEKRHVSVVSIMLGTNDAQDRIAISPEVYRKNISDIATTLLHSKGIKHVILNDPPFIVMGSMGLWGANAAPLLREYAVQIAKVADVRAILKGDTQSYQYFYDHPNELRDGVHPTREGNVHLGSMWARAFRKSLSRV